MISVRGQLTMAQLRQALFEALGEIEEQYSLRHARNVTVFVNPTDEFGEKVILRDERGKVLSRVTKKGPYRSAAEEYNL
ncbi:MAG: hypothetical protein ABS35_28265 [Kaistia sp. SCN 65-12]|nr:MAG: hypothetical protein ABS35_28265 [Kaistia sp. SCN 65-12]